MVPYSNDQRAYLCRLKSYALVRCPNCHECFSTHECADCVLKPYPRIFSGKKTIELEFRNLEDMREWLVHSGLDTDASGNQTWVREKPKTVTLADVDSRLTELTKSASEQATTSSRSIRH